MSLRVWLPLNGDLRNNGLSNITVTNNGATIDNNGKIGKCYSFDGTDDKITLANLPNPSNISVAFWMKRSANTGTRQFMFTAWNGVTCELTTSGVIHCYVAPSHGACDSTKAITVDDGWVHVAYTFEDKVCGKLYINGSLIRTTTSSNSISWNTTTGNLGYFSTYFNGKLNDFRIYDHVLSAKEVKELSKGLVCHYPLNDIKGQENLFNWGNKGNKIITLNNYQNTGSFTQFSSCLTFDAKDTVGTTYTISFWAKSPNGTTSLLLYNNNSTPRYFYFSPTTLTTSLSNEWQYFTYTFINQDRGSGTTTASIYNRIEIYMPSQMGGQVKLIKIEEGEKATSWSPAPSDTYYNKLGYDNNIIYDTSGYGYNGIKNGNGDIIISTNTARNSLSSFFGEHNTPRIDMLDSSLFPALTSCTISWWEYSTVSSNTLIFTGIAAGGSKYIAAGSPTNRLYDSNIGTSGITMYKDGVAVSTTYSGTNVYHNNCFRTQNEWHHYCMTGVNLSSWDKFYINYYSSSFPTQAYLSDVRIYSTVLSEEDIKELYNIGASIDKNGNVFAYEFKED